MTQDLPVIPITVIRYRRVGAELLPETLATFPCKGYDEHDKWLAFIKAVCEDDPSIRIVGPDDAVHKAHDPSRIQENPVDDIMFIMDEPNWLPETHE